MMQSACPHVFRFVGVVQAGSSPARHGRIPFGFACRLVLASSNSFLLSSLVRAVLTSAISLRAPATESLNAEKKASAVDRVRDQIKTWELTIYV